MAERILPPNTMYYAGGTFPRSTGEKGLSLPNTFTAAEYVEGPVCYYGGGTASRPGRPPAPEDIVDENGRELFK